MTNLNKRLQALAPETLQNINHGIEKESLRTTQDAGIGGILARTPHPAKLGSPLTHPHITTDFSEAQLELVSGVHKSIDSMLDELEKIHQVVYTNLNPEEKLWVSSMPCGLPTDENIPLGAYGTSNIGRAKSIYRMGLGHRYGRRMQTISGIHYNWSMPSISTEEYFALIRNFRRHAFLIMLLYGASPAVCSCFVQDRKHSLERLSEGTSYLPYATSLRMGPLGYQSDAQSTLNVSYNSLQSYASSLKQALTEPWAKYEQIGIQNLGGDYNQLATTLLQIENEFYATIRPKRVIKSGERPLHALTERGVEYVEVRLIDLNPFEEIGINKQTIAFLNIFLLHCLLQDSPPDNAQEIKDMKNNQHLTAQMGRKPDLNLIKNGSEINIYQWAKELLEEFTPIAEKLDKANKTNIYTKSIEDAKYNIQNPETLLSAKFLKEIKAKDNSFKNFVDEKSSQTKEKILSRVLLKEDRENFEKMAQESIEKQKQIEKSDTQDFETWRKEYISTDKLGI